MNKILILFVLISFSCTMDPEIIYMWDFDFDKNFSSVQEIEDWVNVNIVYKSEHPKDFWQTPEETLNKMTGDCEDKAFLMMGLIYKHNGVKSKAVLVQDNDDYLHMQVVYQGKKYLDYSYKRELLEFSFDYLPYVVGQHRK